MITRNSSSNCRILSRYIIGQHNIRYISGRYVGTLRGSKGGALKMTSYFASFLQVNYCIIVCGMNISSSLQILHFSLGFSKGAKKC